MTDAVRELCEAAFAKLDDLLRCCRGPAVDDIPAHSVWVAACEAHEILSKVVNLAAIESQAAPEVQCCMCGKRGLSTAEDGGPECELSDGRWVCSLRCYEKAEAVAVAAPEVCKWEGESLLTPTCSPQYAWSRDIMTFPFCPYCGRKIEVAL